MEEDKLESPRPTLCVPYVVTVTNSVCDRFLVTASGQQDAIFRAPTSVKLPPEPSQDSYTMTAEQISPEEYDRLFEEAIGDKEAVL